MVFKIAWEENFRKDIFKISKEVLIFLEKQFSRDLKWEFLEEKMPSEISFNIRGYKSRGYELGIRI